MCAPERTKHASVLIHKYGLFTNGEYAPARNRVRMTWLCSFGVSIMICKQAGETHVPWLEASIH